MSRRTRPSPAEIARADERNARKAENRAAHVGAVAPLKATAAEKLEAIDAQLAKLVETTDGLEQARILDIRGRVVDVQARIEAKATPVATMTDKETEAEAVKFLEGRGWECRRVGP